MMNKKKKEIKAKKKNHYLIAKIQYLFFTFS